MLRTPLPWLAALLVAYLLVPLVAFLFRAPGQGGSATAAPGVGDALRTSLITASVSTAIVTVLGVPSDICWPAPPAGRRARWGSRSSCRWRCRR